MDSTVQCAGEPGAIAVVCGICNWAVGRFVDSTDRRYCEVLAVQESLRHVQEHHYSQTVRVLTPSHYSVDVILSNGNSEDRSLDEIIKRAVSIYRSLPHCNLVKAYGAEASEALQWLKYTSLLRR